MLRGFDASEILLIDPIFVLDALGDNLCHREALSGRQRTGSIGVPPPRGSHGAAPIRETEVSLSHTAFVAGSVADRLSQPVLIALVQSTIFRYIWTGHGAHLMWLAISCLQWEGA